MEGNKRFRVFAGATIVFAMLFYSYEIYLYIENWSSLDEIQQETECDEMFVLELWSFSTNVIWIVSLSVLVLVLVLPRLYKLLLCFMYFMGPVYMT